MTEKEMVIKLLNERNGIITSKQVSNIGVSGTVLARMKEEQLIEKVAHGIYVDIDTFADEYLISQLRCKQGVFSHETALFFHDLTDRTPSRLMLTIPSGYNTRLLKEKEMYSFFYCKKELHDIGQMIMSTPYGNEVMVYNKERTICDIVIKMDKLDTDIVVDAIKRYMKESRASYATLLKYAEKFKIRDKIRQYMEVLS